ncbi:hypothetical protein F9L00_14260 [Brucella anthropi]|uniref:hypothetical protein n=1 Tax=Brucella TaxID=234 RepID=UPI00110F115E|nr:MULTISPECIES: hypothetical protein [Brucella]KAB2776495.1 hypothetical protein F9L00_14260 [Brucella anthropi]TMV03080.1 hypothetical protein FGI60_11730 [Brucella haematophila]
MAKRAKKADVTSSKSSISSEELRRVVNQFMSETAEASEHNGAAGSIVKNALDRHGMDRKAFRFILGLAKMETTKRQATLRGVIELADKMGYFDDVDMFDDIISTMANIVDGKRPAEDETPKKAKAPLTLATVN